MEGCNMASSLSHPIKINYVQQKLSALMRTMAPEAALDWPEQKSRPGEKNTTLTNMPNVHCQNLYVNSRQPYYIDQSHICISDYSRIY
jgi:hypothetical protein